MFRRNRPQVDSAEILKTVVEVAAVKAQAQAIIRRVRVALDELSESVAADQTAIGKDLDKLRDAVDSIPEPEEGVGTDGL